MGWRSEIRQDIAQSRRQARLARADAARARKFAAGTADEHLRAEWLDTADSWDQSACQLDRVAEDFQAILREHTRGYDR